MQSEGTSPQIFVDLIFMVSGVYHEHIFYYSITALRNMFQKHNMTLVDFEEIPIHSGSIRVTVANRNTYLPPKIMKRMELESKNDYYLGDASSEDYLKSFFPERIARPENLKSICNQCLNNSPNATTVKSLREEFFNTNYQGDSGKRAYDLLMSNDWIR